MASPDARLTVIEIAIGSAFCAVLSGLLVWNTNVTNSLQLSNVEMLGKINEINIHILSGKDQHETKQNADKMRSKLRNEIALIKLNIRQIERRMERNK